MWSKVTEDCPNCVYLSYLHPGSSDERKKNEEKYPINHLAENQHMASISGLWGPGNQPGMAQTTLNKTVRVSGEAQRGQHTVLQGYFRDECIEMFL